MYGLSNLKETVLSYIEKHAQDVFKTEGFHELSEETFCVLLASDNLNIDELNLIALVREWATVNSVRSNSNRTNNGNNNNNDVTTTTTTTTVQQQYSNKSKINSNSMRIIKNNSSNKKEEQKW
jgi:hypothetical protein